MNPINNSPYDEFLISQDLCCVICAEPYSVSKRDKMPTQLTCSQHSICIQCLVESGQGWNACPFCRRAITVSLTPEPNSELISSIDRVTVLWNQIEALKTSSSTTSSTETVSSSAASSSQVVEPLRMAVPNMFHCASLCEGVLQYKDVGHEIETILPHVLETMGWGGEKKELVTEFLAKPQEWVVFTSQSDQQTKGFACLRSVSNGKWEAHWSGAIENDPSLYLEMYKSLLITVRATGSNSQNDWKDISLTSFFNYDTEYRWLNGVQQMLVSHQLRYELQYLHRNWGTQVKITVYPYNKPGHPHQSMPIESTMNLERSVESTMLDTWIKHYLEDYGLNALFRQSIPHGSSKERLEEIANYRKMQFQNMPQNFFVYLIDGRAQGFVQFNRVTGEALEVAMCGLSLDNVKYADHFIQQFIEWATTKPIYAKDKTARNVLFSSDCTASGTISSAIDRSKQLQRGPNSSGN